MTHVRNEIVRTVEEAARQARSARRWSAIWSGAFMALGTILALAPRLRRRPKSISSDDVAPMPVAAGDEGSEPDAREEVPV